MSLKNKRNLWGAIFWISSLQYYIAQFVVASNWPKDSGYSWTGNTISDLANTNCGLYGQRLVCSPDHLVMGASFIVLGLTMITGAGLLMSSYNSHNKLAGYGFWSMILAGLGTILVGLFPENTVSLLHVIGAALPFIFGNLGMIIIGFYADIFPRQLKAFSIASGSLGLAALVFFLSSNYFGLGIGGMERIVAYPQSIWMIIAGTYLLHASFKNDL